MDNFFSLDACSRPMCPAKKALVANKSAIKKMGAKPKSVGKGKASEK